MIINGREYQWSDVSLILGGKDVTGVQEISYSEKMTKEAIYGKGNKPVSIQQGNKSYEGEIKVLQSELESLHIAAKAATGSASIMGISLDAVVCYGNPAAGNVMITDRIFGIQFTEDAKTFNQGDVNMSITLPFIAMDIQYQD